MLEQRLIPLTDEQEWEKCLQDISHGPAHLWCYNKAIAKSSQRPTYLYVATAPGFKAVCPIAVRTRFEKDDIVTPYGFGGFISQGTYPNFNQHWISYFSELNYVCGYIALHPYFCQNDLFSQNLNIGGLIYSIDLTSGLEEIFNSFSKVHRYELKQYHKNSFSIIPDKETLNKIAYPLYQQTLSRVSAASVYHFSEETLSTIISSKNSLVLGVAIEGNIEAITIFSYTQAIADYFLNASTTNGRHYTRLLIWESIKILKQLGIPLLNMGGGIKQGDDLDHFKRRFGGKAQTFHILNQIYDEPTFKQLCQQTSVNPNYFPPYYNT